ncbi:hypothetical protein [Planobispora rosea]|uniref:hypothetical protein n=1 Tax=Planobispora rosea TaxID=35762 RepID=UPI00083B2C71|nr:hypothetical protein [Planobispora rosea]
MTASPSPDARVITVTTTSPGCLLTCLLTLLAIVGTFVWNIANVTALSEKIVTSVITLPFAAALVWFVICIPSIRRGSAVAVDDTGLWWSEGRADYADVIPWDEIRAVAVGVWRGPRRSNGLALSRYLEVYLTDPERAGDHPRLASKWYGVRPPVELPDRCFRFHLVARGSADRLARIVREVRPGLWAGEFEHTVAPASAR